MTTNSDELKQILLDEGCGPGNSIHSWRCEYPALYSECNCVDEIVDLIVASEWLAKVKAEAAAEALRTFVRDSEESNRTVEELLGDALRTAAWIEQDAGLGGDDPVGGDESDWHDAVALDMGRRWDS